jgi:ABC-2 type transport system permease protein
MFTRIWNLALKELTQLRRDRLLAPFVILGPTLELILVAYSTSAGIAHLPTAVIDLDRTQASRRLVTGLANAETFELQHFPATVDALAPLVDRGSVSVGIIIPHDFEADLADTASGPPQVQVIVDGSEPAAAQEAIGAAEGVVATFGRRISVVPAAFSQGALQPIDARVRVRFNEELKESNYTIPSEAGFMLSAIAMMVASLGIARERELGTLEQLRVTPLRPVEMIVGKAVPAIILGYIVFLLMLAISLLGFGVPMRGSWPLLLGLAAFYLFVELGWGIMASAVSASQLQALLLVFVFVMVEVVFSGYAFPVENMPQTLQLVANLFPIKHWLIIFRSILLKGAGPAAYWRELIALALLGTGIMGMTAILLRRQRFA